MSVGIFIKQKEFIRSELKKGNKDYEEIYKEAKERQFKKEGVNKKTYSLILALDSFLLAFEEVAKESGFPLSEDSRVYEDYKEIKARVISND